MPHLTQSPNVVRKLLRTHLFIASMNIFFDFELDSNLEQPTNPNNLVFNELRSFFDARYKVLGSEIKDEQKEDEVSFVVLSFKEHGVETYFFNISTQLQEKLKDCITQSDYEYIMDKTWHRIIAEIRKN